VSPEQKRAVQDAMTALASLPGYSGCALVLFTNNFRDAQVAKHGLRDELVDQALASMIEQRHLERPSILVPGGFQRRRHNGSG
jgi:hypothetical protein